MLYALNYGFTGALALDPVEKKPLFHFQPGSMTFSVGAPGCNLTCLGCQNHDLSRPGPAWPGGRYDHGIVFRLGQMAMDNQADSWSFTYSEPTVFLEYAMDLAQEAHASGLPSIWVTNGSMSADLLKALPPAVEAMNVDLKGFTEKFYSEVAGGRLAVVKDNIALALSLGIWVEVTTLLIPGLNDSEGELGELAAFLASLSPDLPWHVSRFFPRHRQSDVPVTSTKSLLAAREIGLSKGLRFVYLGNVAGPGFADTVCPGCGRTLVARNGFLVMKDELAGQDRCSFCRTAIAGRWGRDPSQGQKRLHKLAP
jgi:pyruvate formate lyase activating enzyme